MEKESMKGNILTLDTWSEIDDLVVKLMDLST